MARLGPAPEPTLWPLLNNLWCQLLHEVSSVKQGQFLQQPLLTWLSTELLKPIDIFSLSPWMRHLGYKICHSLFVHHCKGSLWVEPKLSVTLKYNGNVTCSPLTLFLDRVELFHSSYLVFRLPADAWGLSLAWWDRVGHCLGHKIKAGQRDITQSHWIRCSHKRTCHLGRGNCMTSRIDSTLKVHTWLPSVSWRLYRGGANAHRRSHWAPWLRPWFCLCRTIIEGKWSTFKPVTVSKSISFCSK
jgi:hypothetical protein